MYSYKNYRCWNEVSYFFLYQIMSDHEMIVALKIHQNRAISYNYSPFVILRIDIGLDFSLNCTIRSEFYFVLVLDSVVNVVICY